MPIIARFSGEGGGPREQPEAGAYGAVITKVIDLGYQRTMAFEDQESKVVHEVGLVYELDWRDSKGRRPTLAETLTLSTHDRAKLRTRIKACLPSLTEQDVRDFDVERLVGKAVMVQVTVNEKGYARIVAAMPLPAGMPRIQPEDADFTPGFIGWKLERRCTEEEYKEARERTAAYYKSKDQAKKGHDGGDSPPF